MRLRITLLAVIAAGSIWMAQSAAAASQTARLQPGSMARAATWYWSPGWCKSTLHHGGVRFDDGRTFNIQQAYCIGTGGVQMCSWSSDHKLRQYRRFTVLARAYDGTVRSFTLTATSRTNFRATNFHAFRKYASEPFVALALPYAADLARKELAKGCAAS